MKTIRTAIRLCPAIFSTILMSFAADDGIKKNLQIQEPWGDVFGGKETVFHVQAPALENNGGTVIWQFAVGNSTIARGEQPIEAPPGGAAIKLDLPPVKEGVVLQATLTVALAIASGEEAKAVRKLYLFPENPFSDKAEWLKKLNIHLFDPAGKTAELFTKNVIPFKSVNNLDALSPGRDAVLIIGEGTSFKEYRGLANVMMKTAVSGVPVLCLAPTDGDMRLPGSAGDDQPFPSVLTFKRNDVIAQLDKRLDHEGWAPDGMMNTRSMLLQGDRAGVSLEVSEEPKGWPWVDVRFAPGRGRLVLCTFKLVEKWADSPAPRFLLARILEAMANEQPQDFDHGGQE